MAKLGDYMRPSTPPRKRTTRPYLKSDRPTPGDRPDARPAKAGHPHANLGKFLHKAKG